MWDNFVYAGISLPPRRQKGSFVDELMKKNIKAIPISFSGLLLCNTILPLPKLATQCKQKEFQQQLLLF
jgi:hypothetical protein